MPEQRAQRRLAAILVADVVGYARLMGADEAGTLAQLKTLRKELLEPKVDEYGGRIVKTTGDGTLIEFPSVVDAVQNAVDVQRALAQRNAAVPEDRRIVLRIGINVGDVIVDGDDLYGDGVNIAARLEGLAEPGGICLSGMAHEGVRNKLDIGFRDLGEKSVKNIADPIRVFEVVLGDQAAAPATITPSDALFRRPAVAVLPFENLSGDPDQEYFADGLTEDVITALSLWRSFPVIARNSTFAYKGTSPDIRRVGEELGARYVIEGSVRRSGERLRVTAQLINAETGHHVWAERFDRDLADIFDLQDELSQRIAATVAPELEFTESPPVRNTARRNLDAWELVQRGYTHYFAPDRDSVLRAQEFFTRAIEIDPGYARAHAALGYSYHRELWLGLTSYSDDAIARIHDAASRSVSLDDSDSAGHIILAIACFWTREVDRGVLASERAVALNPSNAHAQNVLATALALASRPAEALPWIERALALSPRDPRQGIYMGIRSFIHLTARQYDDAVEWARRAIQRYAEYLDGHLILAASLGHLGRIEEARASLADFNRRVPDDSRRPIQCWSYKLDADNEHFHEGLRKAGWEG